MLNNMLIVALLVLPFLMAVASRAHGSGSLDAAGNKSGWPAWDRLPSTIFFGVAFAAGNYAIYGVWYLAIVGGIVSALGFGTGHGRFFAMRGANLNDPKPERIEKLVQFFYKGDITKPIYSWYCMGAKWLIIGLPVLPYGLALAVLGPASYWFAFRLIKDDSASAEWLTGAFAGLLIATAILSSKKKAGNDG